jgi:nitrogen regulatory protein PII
MSKLVILITSRVEDGHRVGEAWRDAGAPGVTFVESYGLRQLQKATRAQEVLPGLVTMLDLMRQQEETSLIVLSLVEDDTVVDQLLNIAESILGDLLEPNAGIAFVIDVARAIGIRDHGKG